MQILKENHNMSSESQIFPNDIFLLIYQYVDLKTWFRSLQLSQNIYKLLSIDKLPISWGWKVLSRRSEYLKSYKELSEKMNRKQFNGEILFLKKVENNYKYNQYNQYITCRFYFDLFSVTFISKINNNIKYCVSDILNYKKNTFIYGIGLKTGIILCYNNNIYIIPEPDRNGKVEIIYNYKNISSELNTSKYSIYGDYIFFYDYGKIEYKYITKNDPNFEFLIEFPIEFERKKLFWKVDEFLKWNRVMTNIYDFNKFKIANILSLLFYFNNKVAINLSNMSEFQITSNHLYYKILNQEEHFYQIDHETNHEIKIYIPNFKKVLPKKKGKYFYDSGDKYILKSK
jgi:hypothetical protein